MKLEPSEIFKVLSVETRVKIIELLKSIGPMGAKDIAANLGITTAAVSQHLKVLKQAGLVRSERKGYWIPYSIDEKAMENCRGILDEVCTCGCQGTGRFRESEPERSNLDSLKKYAEELRNELATVRQRIKELAAGKG
ncbi:MAG: metalloregulator ArsR/SmtB family transcription factor [Deltaproteobacteria bacterium]|nr:metalloregulator ArsR/SmtB family transcription factor [Deltaproteobacteria bacterium]